MRPVAYCGAVSSLLLAVAPARAVIRTYGGARAYHTMQRGAAEVECCLSLSAPAPYALHGQVGAEHQLERQVGMNDRLDCGIYQVLSQAPGGEECQRSAS